MSVNEDLTSLSEVAMHIGENYLEEFIQSDESDEVIEMLQDRLVQSINQMTVSEDEDEAEEQMRQLVLNLQVRAFLAGVFWKDNETQQTGEEVVTVSIDDTQKLKLTRSLLYGDGISLKIL